MKNIVQITILKRTCRNTRTYGRYPSYKEKISRGIDASRATRILKQWMRCSCG